ncbi:uncharacterized protein Dwil_GK14112 [Drosophila willistoni]|uniref:BPTI/Kunitz inhibitor domain-containing protein n=1 Tax=Drosophila willistoni TaxID=7260 RepID=B4NGQ5_DROWI|nr:kunitz-type serine protease inhibitor 2 [Drosophila willistoni]EDW84402.2 uncharacterized protein Dwil_GK14112 [Drosophila willistoni]
MRFLVTSIILLVFIMLLSLIQGQLDMDEQIYLKKEYKIRKNICFKKPLYGKCSGQRKMWYFNAHRNRCETFIYSNCAGNQNRFFTKPQCAEYCMVFNLTKPLPRLSG